MELLNKYLFRRNARVHDFGNDVNIEVGYFQHPRWQFVTLLERLSGFWPHQSKPKQYALQTFHYISFSCLILTVANKMCGLIAINDTEMTIECGLVILFHLGIMIKLLLASKFQGRRQEIYEGIVEHFNAVTDTEEASILNDCADRGFKYTAIYICSICFIVAVFDSVPLLRSIYNYFYLGDKLIVALPFPMDFGFDHAKYWYVIALEYVMLACSGVLVNVVFDLSFILQIRHARALFEIVALRLKRASELMIESSENDEAVDEAYSTISSAIDLHSGCLVLVQKIEKAYTTTWFLVLLLNTAIFGATIHLISLKLHDTIDVFRYFCAFLLLVVHFFVVFSQGQQIIDSSFTVSYACYDCNWYCLPTKSRKLLLTMMTRAENPCQLTGAKLFLLSMETFSKMLKAGISYYTVFQTGS